MVHRIIGYQDGRFSALPKAPIDGVEIYFEETGQGFPLAMCHEFAGSFESWALQVLAFSQRYRVITYNARGYPPSDVPGDLEAYSQEQHVEDLYGLLDHLGIEQAHICGLSMGGNTALHFGILHPESARSLVVAGAGYGTTNKESFRRQAVEFAKKIEAQGMEGFADYARGPGRTQLLRKNPEAWDRFAKAFAAHSARGATLTFRGVQARRPTMDDLAPQMSVMAVPTLLMVGDEDDLSLEPSLLMKRRIPRSGLVVFPQTGHAINLEEPELFNRVVLDFLEAVEAGGWPERDSDTGVGYSTR